MPIPRPVAVLLGSLRKAAFSRRIAKAMISLAPSSLALDIVEIADLPHYNEDLDSDGPPPAAWLRFREKVAASKAVMFVTPEYNRSVPGALKNALDVGSRPYGQSVWDHKPAAVVSISPGAMGGFGANHHLRQSLVFLDMPTLQQPEAYIGNVATLLDEQDQVKNESTKAFLKTIMQQFATWVDTVVPLD